LGARRNVIEGFLRPAAPSPLAEKPVALIGTSPGPAGTGRAQLQLRQNLLATNSFVLQSPVVQLGGARERFDGDGHLVDEDARELLAGTLRALRDWAVRHRPAAAVEA
jgi:chromate reductase, NAD(P)H dehydrogenase (quinone)